MQRCSCRAESHRRSAAQPRCGACCRSRRPAQGICRTWQLTNLAARGEATGGTRPPMAGTAAPVACSQRQPRHIASAAAASPEDQAPVASCTAHRARRQALPAGIAGQDGPVRPTAVTVRFHCRRKGETAVVAPTTLSVECDRRTGSLRSKQVNAWMVPPNPLV